MLAAHSVMEHPGVVATCDEPLKAILQRIEKQGQQHAFVVDRERRFKGILRAAAAKKAVEKGQTRIDGLYTKNAPKAGPETTLEELVPLSAGNDLPIVIVDKRNRLLGVVPVTSVLKESLKKTSRGCGG